MIHGFIETREHGLCRWISGPCIEVSFRMNDMIDRQVAHISPELPKGRHFRVERTIRHSSCMSKRACHCCSNLKNENQNTRPKNDSFTLTLCP